MAGKPQKRASDLQFKRGGRQERRALRVVAPGERRQAAPRVPKDLGELGRAVWRAYWHTDASLAVTAADMYDLHRYCRLIERREAIERDIYEPLDEETHAGLLVTGSMGQAAVNPKLAIVKELSREIERTREQLGILPLASMRLGVTKVTQDNGLADLHRKLRGLPADEDDEPAGVIDLDELE